MGRYFYRIDQDGADTDDSLKWGWWDSTMDDLCGLDYWLHCSAATIPTEKIKEWYNMLLPHATKPVDASFKYECGTRLPVGVSDADVMLAFMKRTIDAGHSWQT